ncbi:NnrS family protein [Shewanella sedimentimangrovi]|uniref:NnrS family protein n=1 Tax=Shewanella sedimentimangrovi TaxID=2814293 RepID=A0ABX7R480_9GAMM|nr:NnrS family protein [Shewanella sedimentimangrovi]QSX38529.1 NnrS family protein [Shewanella sedimentimangrovi]
MINIDEPVAKQFKPALFRLGFRPFFLFGSLFSMLALLLWLLQFSGWMTLSPHGNLLWWHGHEMLFGFVCAIIVGFLLTAVQNWTGVPGLKGWPLISLFVLWLAPRLLLLDDSLLPPLAAMILDMGFLLTAAAFMAMAVLKVKQWRNLVFVPILLLLTFFNGVSHVALMEQDPQLAQLALKGAAMVVIMVVSLLGGRVIPFFTERATQWQRTQAVPALDVAAVVLMLTLIVSLFVGVTLLTQVVAVLAGLVLLVRWSRWGWRHSFSVPLLWSLHLSFVAIPLGLLLMAAKPEVSAGLHLVTVGGMGSMILAMMARVSLGHTGRTLTPPVPMSAAFGFMIAASVIRPLANLIPEAYLPLLFLSGMLWLVAFGLFIFYYGPMLMAPRVDGRPG